MLACSAPFRGMGIQAAFRAVLKAAGKFDDVANHRFSDETIKASFEASAMLAASGFSTLSLPGIFGDFLNKYLARGLRCAGATYGPSVRSGPSTTSIRSTFFGWSERATSMRWARPEN